MENAITLVKNKNNILPLKNLDLCKIAYVNMGSADASPFVKSLKKYTRVDEVSANNLDALVFKLKQYNTVIIGLHTSNASPWKSYRFSKKELVWLNEIARNNTVILSAFTKPYALNEITSFSNIESVVMAYQNSNIAQQTAAQIIFGGLPAKGTLPVSIGSFFSAGHGVLTKGIPLVNTP